MSKENTKDPQNPEYSQSKQSPQSLRIFTIISQLEQLLESAPKPKLGAGGRSLIDVDEIYDLLGDMKVTIPEDIRRANSVLLEADQLLYNANQEASDILEQAKQEAEALRHQARNELAQSRQAADLEFAERVKEDSVHLEVQRRCEVLQQHAEYSANLVFNNAKEYADAILTDLQRYLMEYHHLVARNRNELDVSPGVNNPHVAQSFAAAASKSSSVLTAPEARPVTVPAGSSPAVSSSDDAEYPASGIQRENGDSYYDDEEVPRRWRGGLFRRNGFLNEDDDASEPVIPKKRSRKLHKNEELDLDLDE